MILQNRILRIFQRAEAPDVPALCMKVEEWGCSAAVNYEEESDPHQRLCNRETVTVQ